MNRSWWIGAALVVTAASALLLPRMELLQSSPKQASGTVETFSQKGDKLVMGEGNLVDAVGGIPFHLPIGSVGWEEGVLSLDLKVTDTAVRPGDVYADMSSVLSFAFRNTENVDQVLLRIMAEDRWVGSSRLLLAADVRRSELTPELLEELEKTGNIPLPASLKSALRISETSLWKNQFIIP
ncbi:hypothetical protein KIH86_04625 [Paenibacillus sp. HN-1]|uniref:hypothetical protein n=1 Tax=Paenibacillus TaxID=44249 RepID=UPI001CA98047|nr:MULTISPECIES: hypothetical protein [Paenibacillus]MBY9081645.1 hypothetical protein [Paenibacillus sp. CGMCC 1.18879]MBY9083514.1 hypothetical protein [Paenibacillus sinensis]